ncbi:hypothetical protein [Tahibacter amnicola]|uniref:Uncharacterized protein n=1 Tax=Tahibacter amnicola TaxID=2976241 RepID=A0ABY6BJH2_9GAMM|nr:hypothetical protein [Tahibacter amnicola]UXI67977.1 hypothetical protein N4264_25160 [Tahibacter amnicola]
MAALHPYFREQQLVLRNRITGAWRRWPETLFHAIAWTVLAGVAVWALRRLDGDRIGLALRFVAEQPLPAGLGFAMLGFMLIRSHTLSLAQELRHGWWGAMPVAASTTRRSLLLTSLLFTTLANLAGAGVLLGIAAVSRKSQHWLPVLLLTHTVGLWLGAALGHASARRTHARPPRPRERDHSSAPVVPMPGQHAAGLRHFPEWQRRDALRRWRSGGRVWQLGAFALLIPGNEGLLSLAGLILLGISLIWYGLALRASEDVIVRSTALFAALPLPFPRLAHASVRYPFAAWLCAAALGGAGMGMQGATIPVAIGYGLVLGAASALALALTLRYRNRPRTARVRVVAEILLVISLAQVIGVFAVLAIPALIVRHYQVARSLR